MRSALRCAGRGPRYPGTPRAPAALAPPPPAGGPADVAAAVAAELARVLGRDDLAGLDTSRGLFDLGLDWAGRRQASIDILSGAATADGLIEEYDVDYVVIGPREIALGASTDHWDRSGTLVYDFGHYRIYRT